MLRVLCLAMCLFGTNGNGSGVMLQIVVFRRIVIRVIAVMSDRINSLEYHYEMAHSSSTLGASAIPHSHISLDKVRQS